MTELEKNRRYADEQQKKMLEINERIAGALDSMHEIIGKLKPLVNEAREIINAG